MEYEKGDIVKLKSWAELCSEFQPDKAGDITIDGLWHCFDYTTWCEPEAVYIKEGVADPRHCKLEVRRFGKIDFIWVSKKVIAGYANKAELPEPAISFEDLFVTPQ